MYSVKEIRKIAKLFEDTNLKIVSHTQHLAENILRPKPAKVSFYQIKFLGSQL
jgi:hypothetical protein